MMRHEGRKFALSCFASLVASGALFFNFSTMDQWIVAQTLIMGMYKVANIVDKARGGQG